MPLSQIALTKIAEIFYAISPLKKKNDSASPSNLVAETERTSSWADSRCPRRTGDAHGLSGSNATVVNCVNGA